MTASGPSVVDISFGYSLDLYRSVGRAFLSVLRTVPSSGLVSFRVAVVPVSDSRLSSVEVAVEFLGALRPPWSSIEFSLSPGGESAIIVGENTSSLPGVVVIDASPNVDPDVNDIIDVVDASPNVDPDACSAAIIECGTGTCPNNSFNADFGVVSLREDSAVLYPDCAPLISDSSAFAVGGCKSRLSITISSPGSLGGVAGALGPRSPGPLDASLPAAAELGPL